MGNTKLGLSRLALILGILYGVAALGFLLPDLNEQFRGLASYLMAIGAGLVLGLLNLTNLQNEETTEAATEETEGAAPKRIAMRKTQTKKRLLGWLLAAWLLIFGADLLGIHADILFLGRRYGEALGARLLGVPIIASVTWLVLVLGAVGAAQTLAPKLPRLLRPPIAAGLVTAADLLIEVSATQALTDFWTWTEGIVPASNYLSHFAIAFGIAMLYEFLFRKELDLHAPLLFSAILLLFFAILALATTVTFGTSATAGAT